MRRCLVAESYTPLPRKNSRSATVFKHRNLHLLSSVSILALAYMASLYRISSKPCLRLRKSPILRFSFQFLGILLLFLVSHFVPPTTQFSFNFPDFKSNTSWICSPEGVPNQVCLQGNASQIGGGELQLTPNRRDANRNYSWGRAVYSVAVPLWNNKTKYIGNFTTDFSFIILASNGSKAIPNVSGDGFAFFLSYYPHPDPDNKAKATGGGFGLTKSSDNASGNSSFVAVEFDNFANPAWDTSPSHVGIDVNSIKSVTTANLSNGFSDTTGKARVAYDSSTQNLSLSLHYPDDPSFDGDPILISHIVDLRDILPENITVGFSGSTGRLYGISRILSWNFTSTMDDNRTSGKGNSRLVAGIVVGVGLLICLAGMMIWFIFFYKKRKDASIGEPHEEEGDIGPIDDELEDERGPRRFTYKELVDATENFKEEGKLGEGGFGPVYRGFLSDLNLDVAVKRISSRSKQGRKEYISEVKIISRLRHRNLVQLVGWCHQGGDFLLIYELMPNGSLDAHLFSPEGLLSWPVRYKIAFGLASALLYLHEEWEQCVVHRDVKSSNVMLDASFNAKLGDFGLARLSEHGSGLQTTFMAGTLGYMAPECFITGKASKESDVYSFGIVALEIACGRKCIEQTVEADKVRLVEWVWRMYGRGMILDVVDERLGEEDEEVDKDQLQRLIMVGLWCAHPDLNLRPSIRQAIGVLNLETSMPSLPPAMPMPTYSSPVNISEHFSSGMPSTSPSSAPTNTATSSSSAPLLYSDSLVVT